MAWSIERAAEWRARDGWRLGFNYVPSTAVNTTEFWQAETFDLPTIRRELTWAAELGFNACRVFLQYLVHVADPAGHLARLDAFLDAAGGLGLAVMPVLFDDCAFAGKQPHLGRQAEPVPGVHNSGWTPSPGSERVRDAAQWPALRGYVQDVLSALAKDERVNVIDLYNEPGNGAMGSDSLALLRAAFTWAREANPSQPLTAGPWSPELVDLNELMLAESDVTSFHSYEPLASVRDLARSLESSGRPLLCTEWMRRTPHATSTGGENSSIATLLPFFHESGISCYQWGLVNGRTQTHLPWGLTNDLNPPTWFHDLLTADGRPHDSDEIEVIRRHAPRRSGGALHS